MTNNTKIQHLKTSAQASSKPMIESKEVSKDLSASLNTQNQTLGADMTNPLEGIFSDAHVVYSYTRAQAIADGVLVDVSELAKEAGFKIPVALTRAVWVDCVQWDEETKERKKGVVQDEVGRLWDLLYMAHLACRVSGQGQRRHFEVYRVPVQGMGAKPRRVLLAVHIGPGDDCEPVITIMQPNED